MAQVRIKVQPSGLINGRPWPEVGKTMDLPDAVADGMVSAGIVEHVEAEKPEKATSRTKPEKRGGRPAKRDRTPREDVVKTARENTVRDVDVPPANAHEGDVEVTKSDDDMGTVPVDDPTADVEPFVADVAGDSPPKPDVEPVTADEVDVDVKVSDLDEGNGTVPAKPVDEQIDDGKD